jgi:hypothetical protein
MKEIKTIGNFLYKRRIFILGLFLFANLGLNTFWIVSAAGDGKIFLLHEDEVIYYCSAKLYAETNSVQAEGCIAEDVSPIGKMNWYGPGYHLLYGAIVKIYGNHHALFPWIHFALAMGIIALVFMLPVSLDIKFLIAITLSLTEQYAVYIFSYFPETWVLFLATVLTLLLSFLYHVKDRRIQTKYVIVFIVVTLLFMFVRVTFIFWLAGLIGLAENRRSVIIRAVILFVGVTIALIYMKFFLAPPFAGEMHKIDLLYKFQITDFIWQTLKAFWNNFKTLLTSKTISIYMLLVLVSLSLLLYYRTKNRLILSSLLISACLLGVLLAYYSVSQFFFIKQSAMLIPILLVGIISTRKVVAFSLLAGFLIVYPSTIRKVKTGIAERREAFLQYSNSREFEKALAEIPTFIHSGSINILWCYNEFDYGNAAEALLPFSTTDKQPILYTTNIINPSEPAEKKFQMHHKLKIDYILSRTPLDWSTLQEVHSTSYYYLYKVLRQ